MNQFVLIDLVSQRHAVRQHLEGRSKGEIVDWLSRHGRIERQTIQSREVFRFESVIGIQATLFFDGDEIVFVGDHHTYL